MTITQRTLVLFFAGVLFWFTNAWADHINVAEFGTGLGFITGSPGETQLAESFTADAFINDNVSVGALIQLVPPGNFTQVAGALVGKYHWTLPKRWNLDFIRVVPLFGLGGVHAELNGNGFKNSTMSYYAVQGVSVDANLNQHFGLSLTFMNNLYDLDLGQGRDRNSQALFFGIRFRTTR
jgi:hypothetical protein